MQSGPSRRAQKTHTRTSLAEILGALSFALDLTEGQPEGHCVRCCWIGVHIGKKAGFDDAALRDLFYTLLLKDLGCSSNAARICQLYLTDDRTFKHDFKTIDGSLPEALKFVMSHTGLKKGLAERFRAMIKIVQNGGQITREVIETRCQTGADIARRLRFPESVASAVKCLDEHWDGSGLPDAMVGGDIPIHSRIALIAQVVDVFTISAGRDAAMAEIRQRSGTWFDPELVDAFESAAAEPLFWEALSSPHLGEMVFDLEPTTGRVSVDEDYLDDIAAAFAKVVDAKSPYTAGHSSRVSVFADMIAEEMGYSSQKRRWLRRGALLHDLGKLGVSNAVLDKPAKLDEGEWDEVRQHPVHSELILERVSVFADLAPIGGGHHERLDGKGYPKGLKGDQISIDTRIVTVADVFDALTADRPYRLSMPIDNALAILNADVGTAFDPICIQALERALARLKQQEAA